MLDQPRAERVRTVAEIVQDARDFVEEYPNQAGNTRAIRNTYFGHFYKSRWLAEMWRHILGCQKCLERYDEEVAFNRRP